MPNKMGHPRLPLGKSGELQFFWVNNRPIILDIIIGLVYVSVKCQKQSQCQCPFRKFHVFDTIPCKSRRFSPKIMYFSGEFCKGRRRNLQTLFIHFDKTIRQYPHLLPVPCTKSHPDRQNAGRMGSVVLLCAQISSLHGFVHQQLLAGAGEGDASCFHNIAHMGSL